MGLATLDAVDAAVRLAREHGRDELADRLNDLAPRLEGAIPAKVATVTANVQELGDRVQAQLDRLTAGDVGGDSRIATSLGDQAKACSDLASALRQLRILELETAPRVGGGQDGLPDEAAQAVGAEAWKIAGELGLDAAGQDVARGAALSAVRGVLG